MADIHPWRAALTTLFSEPPELVAARPPRWRFRQGAMVVEAALPEPGTPRLEISIPRATETWAELLVMARAEALAPSGVMSGDGEFDAAVLVHGLQGAGVRPYALLNARMRTLLIALVRAGVTIQGGDIHLAVRDGDARAVLEGMLELARELAAIDGAAVPRRIVTIANEDPDAGVRARYAELVRSDESLTRFVAERAIRGAAGGSEHFALLAGHLADVSLPLDLQLEALHTLIAQYRLERVASIEGVSWWRFENDDLAFALASALRRDVEGLEGAIRLVRLVFGKHLGRGHMPAILARAMVEALPDAPEAESALVELALHQEPSIARRAYERFVARHHELASLAAALSQPAQAELALAPGLRALVLGRAAAALDEPGSEGAAARELVRRFAGDESDPALLLAAIASHRKAGDGALVGMIDLLLAHFEPAVRRAATAALLDLPPRESLRFVRHTLPKDLLEAATSEDRPRYAADYLVAAFPHERPEATRLPFIDALAQIGGRAHAPFLADMLDEEATLELQCAVLRALGATADSALAARITPFTSGVFRAREVKQAAKAALEAIAKRSAPRGALSLGEDGGGLALPDDEA